MERGHTSVTLTIALSGNESTPLATHQYAGGIVHMPAAWTPASLGFKVASEVTGTFLPLTTSTGRWCRSRPARRGPTTCPRPSLRRGTSSSGARTDRVPTRRKRRRGR